MYKVELSPLFDAAGTRTKYKYIIIASNLLLATYGCILLSESGVLALYCIILISDPNIMSMHPSLVPMSYPGKTNGSTPMFIAYSAPPSQSRAFPMESRIGASRSAAIPYPT